MITVKDDVTRSPEAVEAVAFWMYTGVLVDLSLYGGDPDRITAEVSVLAC